MNPAAKARVWHRVGRIYDSLGSPREGRQLLERAVSIRRDLVKDAPAKSPQLKDRQLELAYSLDYLTWANAHSDRNQEAIETAFEAWRLRTDLLGERADDTLASHFDYARMLLSSVDKTEIEVGKRTFLEAMGLALDKPATTVENELRTTVGKAGMKWRANDETGAMEEIEQYVQPLLGNTWPRLRSRLPWSLAQFGEYIALKWEAPALLRPLQRPAGLAAANTAARLSTRLLAPGHPDVDNIQKLLAKLDVGDAKAPSAP
jgi:hypothetical protein